ncbi:hypothetical protein [Kitasatospora camelliae]|uniref:Tocopherol cyclase-like protein n=1 Tax=Kitasatospora camelliae TaxID=3156397 RepID=A0AAU8JS65_9ACTN
MATTPLRTPLRGTAFRETMHGTVRLAGETRPRRIRLDLAVRADRILLPHRTTDARLTGRVRIQGLADDPDATGELEISPVARRRIRYRLEFTAGGDRLTLDGWKSVSVARPWRSMTTLPFTLAPAPGGAPAGTGVLRFRPGALLPFLAGWRFPRGAPGRADHHAADRPAARTWRWDGTPGRTEVWYTTLTDPATGTGLWLHHELTAPTDGTPARTHGWISLHPPAGPAEHARTGPRPWTAGEDAHPLRGSAGPYGWDLTEHPQGPPLYTFPRWAWRWGLLPAAHLLTATTSRYSGTVTHPGGRLVLDGAPGATARIHGHGYAERWAWLHADLGGGDVLEVIAAVARRPGLDRLPPLVFLRLHRAGRTWPRTALRPAVGWLGPGRFRARIALPEWTVTGRTARHRITVTVRQDAERTLTLGYTDPDGAAATCHNTETADAHVTLERRRGLRWQPEAVWTLTATAHAEVGHR